MAEYLRPRHDYNVKRPMATRRRDDSIIIGMALLIVIYVTASVLL